MFPSTLQSHGMHAGLAEIFLAVGALHGRHDVRVLIATSRSIFQRGRPRLRGSYLMHNDALRLQFHDHSHGSDGKHLAVDEFPFLDGFSIDECPVGRAQIGHHHDHRIDIELAVILGHRGVVELQIAVPTPTDATTPVGRQFKNLPSSCVFQYQFWHKRLD